MLGIANRVTTEAWGDDYETSYGELLYANPEVAVAVAMFDYFARDADFCVAVNGGFGSGGTTFVGKGFLPPTHGTCKTWAGIVKTASTVVGTSTGATCLSDDGELLTITL
jgi:hypothetical protein